MVKKTWIVVANSAVARIFQIVKGPDIKELEAFLHPESRLRNHELISDRPGRGYESFGTERHAIEPKTTPHKQEFLEFGKHLAKHLEEARRQGSFERLFLAANPAFLGILRQALDPSTAGLIEKEVDKDLAHLSAQEIARYFPPFDYQ